MAQIYAVCWQVLSTAALAYWPVFVKRRAATEETVRMWWRLTGTFAAVAVIATLGLVPLGPWAATLLSGGRIDVSTCAGVGVRCLAGGAGRAPTGQGAADQTQ